MIFMSKKEETLALLLKKCTLMSNLEKMEQLRKDFFLIKYVRGIILKVPGLRSRLMY